MKWVAYKDPKLQNRKSDRSLRLTHKKLNLSWWIIAPNQDDVEKNWAKTGSTSIWQDKKSPIYPTNLLGPKRCSWGRMPVGSILLKPCNQMSVESQIHHYEFEKINYLRLFRQNNASSGIINFFTDYKS